MMPPTDVVEKLAPEREQAAVKEAGRAVALVAFGLPLHDLSVEYRRSPRRSGWIVEARTREVRRGALNLSGIEAVNGMAVAAAAGPVAEARWLAQHNGMTLAAALLQTFRPDDAREAARYHQHSDWSLDAEVARTTELVEQQWATITAVAAELLRHGRLTGDEVRRLVAQQNR